MMVMKGNLPSRVTVLPNVHLSKAADIANPDHVDCEVAEEINDLLKAGTNYCIVSYRNYSLEFCD